MAGDTEDQPKAPLRTDPPRSDDERRDTVTDRDEPLVVERHDPDRDRLAAMTATVGGLEERFAAMRDRLEEAERALDAIGE